MHWNRVEDVVPPKSAIDDRWTWRAPDPVPMHAHHGVADQDRAPAPPDEDLRHSPLLPPPA